MRYEERVPSGLFQEGHFLGRPADFTDRIVARRIRLVEQIPAFTGTGYELLDIGCGNGASMFMLAGKMKYCLGIEVTAQHRPEFENYKLAHNIGNCDYMILDVEKSSPPRQFDRIISFEVIEHLTNESAVKFYYDALKKGGLMAVSVPNKWWIFETHGARLPLLPWNRVPLFSWLPKPIHQRLANARIYTRGRIKKLLEQHGFEVIDSRYITAPMDVLKEGRMKDFLVRYVFNSDTTAIPCLATSIFVVARKN